MKIGLAWASSICIISLTAAAAFAQATCEETTLQTQIDQLAAAGGGTVQLQPRVYQICDPIILRSNIHLRGAGRGATIIRGSTTTLGVTVDNSWVSASIGAVGTTNMSVSDLTIDHATNRRDTNGISFLPGTPPGGEDYSGTPPTNGLIQRVEILGTPDVHAYLIWNLRGQHIKIINNWLDGNTTYNSNQEGIESYGGSDVVITNNSVRRIGSACINVGTAGDMPDSSTNGVVVSNNDARQCKWGVHIGTAGGQSNASTEVRGNVIEDARKIGIDIVVDENTAERGLLISQNAIRNITATSAAGISVRTAVGASTVTIAANTVSGNHIENIRGVNAHGIYVAFYKNLRIIDNTIDGVDHEGVIVFDSTDLEIARNQIQNVGQNGISVQKLSSTSSVAGLIVSRNTIADWGSTTGGVLLVGGHRALIFQNVFKRSDDALPGPIIVDGSSCGVTASGNLTWYSFPWQDTNTAACP